MLFFELAELAVSTNLSILKKRTDGKINIFF